MGEITVLSLQFPPISTLEAMLHKLNNTKPSVLAIFFQIRDVSMGLRVGTRRLALS
jgi:hypothetical protein